MEQMLIAAIILLALAALMGILLVYFLLDRARAPQALLLTHGTVAALGFLLLVLHAMQTGEWMTPGLTVIVITALGGVHIAIRNVRLMPPPLWVGILHGGAGLLGFGLLLYLASR